MKNLSTMNSEDRKLLEKEMRKSFFKEKEVYIEDYSLSKKQFLPHQNLFILIVFM